MTSAVTKVILLAEDEPAHATIIRLALQRNVGDVQLRQVEDGKAALDYLYRREDYEDPAVSPKPDLILLDLRMPRMSELEVLSIVKKAPELQTIPVVVLTTSDLIKDRLAAADDMKNQNKGEVMSELEAVVGSDRMLRARRNQQKQQRQRR